MPVSGDGAVQAQDSSFELQPQVMGVYMISRDCLLIVIMIFMVLSVCLGV